LKSDYKKLMNTPTNDNAYLTDKLWALINEMVLMKKETRADIILRMPDELYLKLK
jgi:hypothetical protein